MSVTTSKTNVIDLVISETDTPMIGKTPFDALVFNTVCSKYYLGTGNNKFAYFSSDATLLFGPIKPLDLVTAADYHRIGVYAVTEETSPSLTAQAREFADIRLQWKDFVDYFTTVEDYKDTIGIKVVHFYDKSKFTAEAPPLNVSLSFYKDPNAGPDAWNAKGYDTRYRSLTTHEFSNDFKEEFVKGKQFPIYTTDGRSQTAKYTTAQELLPQIKKRSDDVNAELTRSAVEYLKNQRCSNYTKAQLNNEYQRLLILSTDCAQFRIDYALAHKTVDSLKPVPAPPKSVPKTPKSRPARKSRTKRSSNNLNLAPNRSNQLLSHATQESTAQVKLLYFIVAHFMYCVFFSFLLFIRFLFLEIGSYCNCCPLKFK